MNQKPRTKNQLHLLLLVVALLIGGALRFAHLDTMQTMLHYDEAFYAVDALSQIETPRFTPFFAGNFGRESLWMYWLTPALSAFGAESFALRVTAAFTGVLTLAAAYRLTRAVAGRQAALWGMLALAVLYFHVHMSHLAFRALLFPLVGMLAFAFLWDARRTNRLRLWLAGGVLLGLLAYTYFAARAWIILAALLLVWWFIRQKPLRRGVLIAVGLAVVMALPLIVYLANNPASGERFDQVLLTDPARLIENAIIWLRAFVTDGSPDVVFNLPGRPLLDLPLLFLALLGVVGALRLRRDKLAWLILLMGASVAPALLTTEPLKWLRAIGIAAPIMLVVGLGAGMLTAAVSRIRVGAWRAKPLRTHLAAWGILFIFILFTFSALTTARDFDAWVTADALYFPMEQHLNTGIDWIAANTPNDAPIYFAPFTPDHPVIRFRAGDLGSRPVGAFMPDQCVVIPDQPAYYLAITPFTPDLEAQLSRFAKVNTIHLEGERYSLWRAEPSERVGGGDDLGGGLSTVGYMFPESDNFEIIVLFSGENHVTRPLTFYAHLYDDDGTLVAQDDRPICPSYPPVWWRADERIAQRFSINAPSGEYRLGVGVYDSVTLERQADTLFLPVPVRIE